MDMPLLVARAAAGDLDALGRLYDAEFGRVYDFAWRLTRDNARAGEIVRATFVAARGHLREIAGSGGDFHAWAVLATARDALARAEADGSSRAAPQHEEAFGAFDVPDACRLRDPNLLAGDPELPCLVWEAAGVIGRRDYALLDLHQRQEIAPAALASILGVPRGSAPATLERLERAASDAMLTYVLARRGGKNCDPLRKLLIEQGFPPYSESVQAAVDAHAAGCETCRRNRPIGVPPVEVLAGFMPVPAPFVLKGETWREIAAGWPAPGAATGAMGLTAGALSGASRGPDAASANPAGGYPPPVAEIGSPGGGDGGPMPYALADADDGRRNVVWFIAAAAGMLLVAFLIGGVAVGAFGLGGGGGGGSAAVATTPTQAPETAAAETSTPEGPGVTVDTPSPAPSRTATPTPTETVIPSPTPPPAATATPTITPAVRTATPTRTPGTGTPTTPGQKPTATATKKPAP